MTLTLTLALALTLTLILALALVLALTLTLLTLTLTQAHQPASEVGLRILHRTTIRAPGYFDPPFDLPARMNINGRSPYGEGVWSGGGIGFRWDETIPMQN